MMQYQISIEGQTIPVPEEIGISDDLVKQSLVPYFPEVANALITRVPKDETVIITVTKRAGTKGGWQDLIDTPERRNPVIELQAKLIKIKPENLSVEKSIRLEHEIEKTVEEGEKQRNSVVFAKKRLQAARAIPSIKVPEGF